MGLDISYHSNLKFLGPPPPEKDRGDEFYDDLYDNNQVLLEVDTGYPSYPEGLEPGIYQVGDESHSFRAGSYSGYGYWRELLCRFSDLAPDPVLVWDDPDQYRGRPFQELVNFSDCEGWIGPVVAAKLAKDFQEQEVKIKIRVGKAVEIGEMEDAEAQYFMERYQSWKTACEVAAQNGVIEFH